MPATATHQALSCSTYDVGPGQIAVPNAISKAKTAFAGGSPSCATRMRVTVDLVTPASLASVRVECPVWVIACHRFAASVAANCWAASSLICMATSLAATIVSCGNRRPDFTADSGRKFQTIVENLLAAAGCLRPALQPRSLAVCISALLSLAVL